MTPINSDNSRQFGRLIPSSVLIAAVTFLFLVSGVSQAYAKSPTYNDAPADKPGANDEDSKSNDAKAKTDPESTKDSKGPGAGAAAPATEEQIRALSDRMKALEDLLKEERKESDEKVSRLQRIIEQQQKLTEALQAELSSRLGLKPAGVSDGTPESALATAPGDRPTPEAAGPPVASASAPGATPAGSGPNALTATAPTAATTNTRSAKTSQEEPSPLSLKIGSAYITPVGYADFLLYYRSTDVGSGLSTNFGSIPFANTPQGQLSELRTTAQASRLGARIDVMVHDAHVLGYFETDFLGAVPGNAAVTSNSASQRIRLAWIDVRKGKFEVLGGQSWSLLTPDKNSLSPLPNDVYYGHLDPGNQLGLTWKRDPQIRFVYHAADWLTFGVSAEQPEQYIGGSGGAGVVTLPSALASAYGTELDNGNTTQTVPNVAPDFIVKVAFDPKVNGRDLHVELNGLERNFKVFNPLSQKSFSATGGGGSLNLSLQVLKQLRLISENFYSDGGGRYVFGEAPDLVIRGDGSISLVRTYSTFQGFEAPFTDKTTIYAYFGGVYAAKNTVFDPATHTLVGFGYPGAPTSQNRAIEEPTFGFSHTFWRDPRYGALQMNLQYSYVTRSPWIAPAKGPTTANTNMLFVDFRYILPGAPPKLPLSY